MPIFLKLLADSDALDYSLRAGITDKVKIKKISDFISGLKNLGLWDNLVDAWIGRPSFNNFTTNIAADGSFSSLKGLHDSSTFNTSLGDKGLLVGQNGNIRYGDITLGSTVGVFQHLIGARVGGYNNPSVFSHGAVNGGGRGFQFFGIDRIMFRANGDRVDVFGFSAQEEPSIYQVINDGVSISDYRAFSEKTEILGRSGTPSWQSSPTSNPVYTHQFNGSGPPDFQMIFTAYWQIDITPYVDQLNDLYNATLRG